MNTLPRLCCVMASDAPFFYQTSACIETFEALYQSFGADLKVIDLGLDRDQAMWLMSRGIECPAGIAERVPRFQDGPLNSVAMTCRPFLPQLFPGYEAYMWIDSDIRFLHPDGFTTYLHSLLLPRCAIVIAHETEPAYGINQSPELGAIYHRWKNARLREAFGAEVAHYLEFMVMFNAGIFSAPADSPLWLRYQRNVEKTLRLPYDRMREQDAMLVTLAEVQGVVKAPSVANWLCSLRMPVRRVDAGGDVFFNPDDPTKQILAAHLTNSSKVEVLAGERQTFYEYYRKAGLTR